MDKPNAHQVAWVFKHLVDQYKQGGTFRHLIYDRMGFTTEQEEQLREAGGQTISNILYEASYRDFFKD